MFIHIHICFDTWYMNISIYMYIHNYTYKYTQQTWVLFSHTWIHVPNGSHSWRTRSPLFYRPRLGPLWWPLSPLHRRPAIRIHYGFTCMLEIWMGDFYIYLHVDIKISYMFYSIYKHIFIHIYIRHSIQRNIAKKLNVHSYV
jgi:hypothetical protein